MSEENAIDSDGLKKINSVDELPEWFKKKHYRKNLSPQQWCVAIGDRINFKLSRNRLTSLGKAVRQRLLSKFEALMENEDAHDPDSLYLERAPKPVGDLGVIDAAARVGLYQALHPESRDLFNEVFSLAASHNLMLEAATLSAFRRHFEEVVHLRAKLDKDEKTSNAIFDGAASGNPFLNLRPQSEGVPIYVDTAIDDKTLLKAFKEWLVGYRSKTKIKAKRPFAQSDFDDWAHFKVREIYDLNCWAGLASVKIPDRVMAQALWPVASDTFSPIDVLRTTGRTKSTVVMSNATQERLYAQIRLAHGEKIN